MDFTKILAAGFVVLIAAGAVAAGGTGSSGQVTASETASVTNADVDTVFENGTVSLTLVDEGEGASAGVANATVDVTRSYEGDEAEDDASERIGMTDANGTVMFDLRPDNESRNVTAIDVSLTNGAFSAELDYRVDNGTLVLTEEEYEYAHEDERGEADEQAVDDAGQLGVSMEDARATADAALMQPTQGEWRLVEADAHEEDNYYEFEYVLVNADQEGETEIRVHGSSGDIIEYEQEIDGLEDEDEREDAREDEREDAREDEREDAREDEREDAREDDEREVDDEHEEDEHDDEHEEDEHDD